MSAAGSVTCWLEQLKAGDQAAIQKIWDGYFQRLVGLAREVIGDDGRRFIVLLNAERRKHEAVLAGLEEVADFQIIHDWEKTTEFGDRSKTCRKKSRSSWFCSLHK